MTIVDLILELISNNNSTIKTWSERFQNNGLSYLASQIREILLFLSGDDLINLIKSILNKEEIDQLSEKYVNALEFLAIEINKQKKKKKTFLY
jgi:hypothetical protein